MYLGENHLSGNISSIFLKFNSSLLQNLGLGTNKLSGNLPSNICQGIPNVRYLSLGLNDLSGDMPNVWHQCQELEELYLSFSGFNRGPIPRGIRNMTKLQALNLSGNNLEGKIFPLIFHYLFLYIIKVEI
jgi:LRR receptor-like serine/threonine-protein kinase FLS2